MDANSQIPCKVEDEVTTRPISYENIFVAFLILPTGTVFAFAILIIEKCFKILRQGDLNEWWNKVDWTNVEINIGTNVDRGDKSRQ